MAASTTSSQRYCDQPTSWPARLAGLSGTTGIAVLALLAALFTWQTPQRVSCRTLPR
jgi:hypothetical protein